MTSWRISSVQGYIAGVTRPGTAYAHVLERQQFSRPDERPVLDEIEGGTFPLVRLGRWPDGARSALSLTGNTDALTIWGNASRFSHG